MRKLPRPDADHVLFALGWVIATPLWVLVYTNRLRSWGSTVYALGGGYITWHAEVLAWTAPAACLCWCAAAIVRFFKTTPERGKLLRRIGLGLLNIVMVYVMTTTLFAGVLATMLAPDFLQRSPETSATGCRIVVAVNFDFRAREGGTILLEVPGEHRLRNSGHSFQSNQKGRPHAEREHLWKASWSGGAAHVTAVGDGVVLYPTGDNVIHCPAK